MAGHVDIDPNNEDILEDEVLSAAIEDMLSKIKDKGHTLTPRATTSETFKAENAPTQEKQLK